MRSYSDNAMMAKARSMYGRRLTEADYSALLQKKTVGEIAAYLKKETHYASALREVREDLVHRGQLELLIRRHTLDTCVRLMKYASSGALVLQLYIAKNEIQQILTAIRLLNSGASERLIVSMPVYLARHMSFDLFRLAEITSFDDLLEVLEHTQYYRVLGPFRPAVTGSRVDITACERALLDHYYTQALELVGKRYSGAARDSLRDILYRQIDYHNLTVLYRTRRYFGLPPQEVRPLLLGVRGKLTTQTLEGLLECTEMDGLMAAIRSIPALRLGECSNDAGQVSQRLTLERQRHSRRQFRFSVHPVVSVMSYLTLLENEGGNIISIIEGIRYAIPPEEIRSLLNR